ncbi:MAG: MBL fold metallo-hydrolase [Chloroflexi bacterium]|nr:MBL fold metallo-hydrolase [Chloroflexota bacterium]
MEIAGGVYQLKLPLPINSVVPDAILGDAFSYLVKGEDGYILIDAGWNDRRTLEIMLASLDAIEVKPAAIRWIVVTHYHPDHFGLVDKLRELTGARVAMHYLDMPDNVRSVYVSRPDAASWVQQWRRSQGMSEADIAAMPALDHGVDHFLPPIDVDVRLKGGEEIDGLGASLKVVWTPGHTVGHICLYDGRRKILFSGDQVLPEITPHISVHPHTEGDPLGDYLDSLERLDRMDVNLVLPGHEYAFEDIYRRNGEIRQHHYARLQETLKALGGGPETAYQVASELKWGPGPWHAMSAMNRQLAMFETLAHLRHMQQRGQVQTFTSDGMDFYERV